MTKPLELPLLYIIHNWLRFRIFSLTFIHFIVILCSWLLNLFVITQLSHPNIRIGEYATLHLELSRYFLFIYKYVLMLLYICIILLILSFIFTICSPLLLDITLKYLKFSACSRFFTFNTIQCWVLFFPFPLLYIFLRWFLVFSSIKFGPYLEILPEFLFACQGKWYKFYN